MNPTDVFLDQNAAAAFCTVRGLPISPNTLNRLRVRGIGGGPKFVRWGRAVRYLDRDLLVWMGERLNQTPISGAAA
jgi:hypothetical protein